MVSFPSSSFSSFSPPNVPSGVRSCLPAARLCNLPGKPTLAGPDKTTCPILDPWFGTQKFYQGIDYKTPSGLPE